MARLVGVDLPRDKRMEIALTYIYGIGRTRSNEILAATGIDKNMRTKDLTDDQVTVLRDYIEGNLKVEGDLRREVQADIRRKIEIGCYQACATAVACPCVDSAPRQTRAPARVRSAPSPARRRPGNPDGTGKEGRHGRQEGSEDPPQGKEERPARRRSHQEHVQQHDRVDHRSPGNVIAWASSGHVASRARVSPPRSPRSWPPRTLPARRRSTV